mgnify:CR=1 FL=1
MSVRDGFNFGIGMFLSSVLIFLIGLLIWFIVFCSSTSSGNIYDKYTNTYKYGFWLYWKNTFIECFFCFLYFLDMVLFD